MIINWKLYLLDKQKVLSTFIDCGLAPENRNEVKINIDINKGLYVKQGGAYYEISISAKKNK